MVGNGARLMRLIPEKKRLKWENAPDRGQKKHLSKILFRLSMVSTWPPAHLRGKVLTQDGEVVSTRYAISFWTRFHGTAWSDMGKSGTRLTTRHTRRLGSAPIWRVNRGLSSEFCVTATK